MLARRFNRAARAARFLQSQSLQMWQEWTRPLAEIVTDLVRFAPKTQNQRGRYVGVVENARKCPLELIEIRTHRHRTAFAMRESNHAVDVFREFLICEAVRDQLGRVRGAIAGRHHRNVVARAHSPVSAPVAEKRSGSK